MVIYTFKGGTEIFQLKAYLMEDLFIRANNKLINTQGKFLSISKLLGEEKSNELKEKLRLIYEKYIMTEMAKIGYTMVRKNANKQNRS